MLARRLHSQPGQVDGSQILAAAALLRYLAVSVPARVGCSVVDSRDEQADDGRGPARPWLTR
jgi:hypothetical protein